MGPFTVVLREHCQAVQDLDTTAVVDAKSVYDSLQKATAGSRQDRRAAIDLAIIRQSMLKRGSKVRWVPHWRMPVDVLTKADISRCNDALEDLVRRGRISLAQEEEELEKKEDGDRAKEQV